MFEMIAVLQPGWFQLCGCLFSISYICICILFILVTQAQSGEPDVRAEVKMQAAVTTAEHAHTKPRPETVHKPAFDDAGCHGYRHQDWKGTEESMMSFLSPMCTFVQHLICCILDHFFW